MVNWLGQLSLPLVPGATRTGVFTISNVNTSSAGSYQCRATVEYTGVNEQFIMEPSPTDSTAVSLTVQCK